jgi:hypothetical protein
MKPRFKVVAGRPMEIKPRLRPVPVESKLEAAIRWLRDRGLYILDKGTPRPKWGIAGDVPPIESPLFNKVMEADRRRKK